jgi:signal peptidase I
MVGLAAPGDVLLAEYGHYKCHPVERDDWVMVSASGRSEPILKRAVVLPGDRFSLQQQGSAQLLVVNGKVLQTPARGPYRFSTAGSRMLALYVTQFGGVMPEDTYLVLGTDPAGTLDSTRFGPVTRDALVARARRVP